MSDSPPSELLDRVQRAVDAQPTVSADAVVAGFLCQLIVAIERAEAGVAAGVEAELLDPLRELWAGWLDGIEDGLPRWFGDEGGLVGAAATRQLARFRDRVAEWTGQLAHQIDELLQSTAAPEVQRVRRWRLSWLPRSAKIDEAGAPSQTLLRALGGDGSVLGQALLARLLRAAGLAVMADAEGSYWLGEGREDAVVYRAQWIDGGSGEVGEPVAVRIAADGHARPKLRPASPFVLERYGGMRSLGFGVEALELFDGVGLDQALVDATGEDRLWISFQLTDALRALHQEGLLDTLPSTDDVLVAEGSWSPIVRLRAAHGGSSMGEEAAMTAVAVLVGGVVGAEHSEMVAGLVDGPAPLVEKMDTLCAELARGISSRPSYRLGELAERARQIQSYFTRQCDALEALERVAADSGWSLIARPAEEAVDTALGNPETVGTLVESIQTEVIPFFARPYQIALMGVFSSGKTFLINKLLLRMAGLPLAPYSPKPAYRLDPRYVEIQPYLRRSTAEPTDTVVTIIRAPGKPGDDERQEQLKSLIEQERPQWPEDPLELPVPLEELERFNLIDTPGLNEDLTVNKRVGGFLQSCDLIVYVFAATAVMNSQDHFLIRRKHEVAPGKRMIFAINMIDVLLNRLEHTAFWEPEHEQALVEVALPLRQRIKDELAGITGEAPPLVLGQDLWVLSGLYDHNVEALYDHLVALIESTAALDRLRGTPGVMRAHLAWARGFARRQISRALRPRLALVEQVERGLAHTFERELPRRIGDDWEKALGDFHRRHTLAERPYGATTALTLAEPAEVVSWNTRLEGGEDWSLEGKHMAEDYPVLGSLVRAATGGADGIAGTAADALLAPVDLADLRQRLAGVAASLIDAAASARSQVDRALDEFVDSTLPTRTRAAQTALGREIGRVCEEALAELGEGYRRELGASFGGHGTPEASAAMALLGEAESSGDETSAASELIDGQRAQLHARIEEDGRALAAMVEAIGETVDGARARLATAIAAGLSEVSAPEGEGGGLRTRASAAVDAESARLAGTHVARWAGPALAAILVLMAPAVGGGMAIALVVLAIAAGGGGWWLWSVFNISVAERRATDEQELTDRWARTVAALDQRERGARDALCAELAEWRAALAEVDAEAARRGEALAAAYRALFLELYRGESLARWTADVAALAGERLGPLRELADALRAAIAEVEAVGLRLAAGAVALDIDAFEALARVHSLAHSEGG